MMRRARTQRRAVISDDAVCKCTHRADEHGSDMPAPCLHGNDGVTIDPKEPGYGCQCIAFTFVVPKTGRTP